MKGESQKDAACPAEAYWQWRCKFEDNYMPVTW